MRPCFLGIDIGTGSSKGALTDEHGTILAQDSLPHTVSSPHPGWFEQDADAVWWHDFVSLSRSLTSQVPAGYAVMAVSCSAIAPCVLPVEKDGTPLRAGILYGIDTRAAAEIEELTSEIGKDAIFSMTGQQLSSQSCCPKIRWIEKHEPHIFERTAKFLTATGYVNYRLTGNYCVDMYDAIGYAPFFDLAGRRWDDSYEQAVCDLSLLPEILWSTEPCGRVTPAAAEATGLPPGIPVFSGAADAAAEAVAAGVSAPGDMMMMYGSSNFFIMRTAALLPAPSFWASNFLSPGEFVLTGGMTTVGSLFNWFTETFPGKTMPEWEELASASPPGARGIITLPYFAGERTPLFDPDAKGVFFGLTLQSGAGDLFRSCLEAVGFGIRHNLEVLSQEGQDARRIIAIGGGINSTNLMQAVCDITGVTQAIPDCTLGACYGSAYIAAVGSGMVGRDARWTGIEREYTPEPANRSLYDEAYGRYRSLYESTKHIR